MHEPKYFSLDDAQSALPLVKKIAADIDNAVKQMGRIPGGVALLHGAVDELAVSESLRDEAIRLRDQVSDLSEELNEVGAELKGLQPVLVDFPSLRNNQEVYLCWAFGEDDISFWHTPADGFRGRQPL